jgi:hypothetical protein
MIFEKIRQICPRTVNPELKINVSEVSSVSIIRVDVTLMMETEEISETLVLPQH